MTDRYELPSLRLARTPSLARRVSRGLLVLFVLLPFVLAFVAWTQSVHGSGKAIAFNPVQRPQFVVSPIEGRIRKWYVVEGQRVSAGERIVEMVDNDPNLELRLLDEERAILDRMRAAEGRVRDIEARIRNLESSRELAIAVQQSLLHRVDDQVLNELAKIRTLRHVDIQGGSVTAAGVERFAAASPQCRVHWSGSVVRPR